MNRLRNQGSIFRLCIFFFACFLCLQQAMARQDELNPKTKNESPLRFLSKDAPARGDDVVGATFCSGAVDSATKELERIGISKEDLRNEVYCTVGDFDGNGYLDFAIWGGNKQRKKWPDYQNYLVLFFEKDKLIKSISIKSDHPGGLLVHYPPRAQSGPNGEPISTNDALWAIGETNGYDDVSKGIVYLFDLKSAAFKKLQFGGRKRQ